MVCASTTYNGNVTVIKGDKNNVSQTSSQVIKQRMKIDELNIKLREYMKKSEKEKEKLKNEINKLQEDIKVMKNDYENKINELNKVIKDYEESRNYQELILSAQRGSVDKWNSKWFSKWRKQFNDLDYEEKGIIDGGSVGFSFSLDKNIKDNDLFQTDINNWFQNNFEFQNDKISSNIFSTLSTMSELSSDIRLFSQPFKVKGDDEDDDSYLCYLSASLFLTIKDEKLYYNGFCTLVRKTLKKNTGNNDVDVVMDVELMDSDSFDIIRI